MNSKYLSYNLGVVATALALFALPAFVQEEPWPMGGHGGIGSIPAGTNIWRFYIDQTAWIIS